MSENGNNSAIVAIIAVVVILFIGFFAFKMIQDQQSGSDNGTPSVNLNLGGSASSQ